LSSESTTEAAPEVDSRTLTALELAAVRMAHKAGEHICAAFGRPFAVEFKQASPGASSNSNPVSEVDCAVEAFIRAELQSEFPDHAVIGEEGSGSSHTGAGFTWVLDPIDGTTNFINGLPLFASSIGVLLDGWPVAGAIWCVSTHALRPGVYHARRGGPLCFDHAPIERRRAGAWRGLAAEPGWTPSFGAQWDTRVLGSAALECAFVAAGLLRLAYVSRPRLWDAAAAVTLLNAAGCEAMTRQASQWVPLTRFIVAPAPDGCAATLGSWCQPLLAADREALTAALVSAPAD
jgi:myo-inositol-1(or 4)-monophosphatase